MREESLARKNAGSLPWRDLGPRVPCTDCTEPTSSPRGPEACTSMGILNFISPRGPLGSLIAQHSYMTTYITYITLTSQQTGSISLVGATRVRNTGRTRIRGKFEFEFAHFDDYPGQITRVQTRNW